MKKITLNYTTLQKLISDKPIFLIAREDIKKGDICSILWKKYCRRCITTDCGVVGVAFDSAKKGEKVILCLSGIWEKHIHNHKN